MIDIRSKKSNNGETKTAFATVLLYKNLNAAPSSVLVWDSAASHELSTRPESHL
jgi:hypothetical protein